MLHLVTNYGAYLFHLFGRGWLVLVADKVYAQRCRTNVRGYVWRDPFFLKKLQKFPFLTPVGIWATVLDRPRRGFTKDLCRDALLYLAHRPRLAYKRLHRMRQH